MAETSGEEERGEIDIEEPLMGTSTDWPLPRATEGKPWAQERDQERRLAVGLPLQTTVLPSPPQLMRF